MNDSKSLIARKLSHYWDRKRAATPGLSLRAFSRGLGMGVGALSQLLNGKRPLTVEMARRLGEAFALSPGETVEIVALATESQVSRRQPGSRLLSYVQLSEDQLKTVAEWRHLALLSLLETTDFDSDPAWIARRLKTTPKEARDLVERLLRLGLLVRDAQGALKRGSPRYQTTEDVMNLSIRKAHDEALDLARSSLKEDPLPVRDFSSMTMAIDPSLLPQAKALIRKFQDDLSLLLEKRGRQTEVYRINMQLFPLTGEKG